MPPSIHFLCIFLYIFDHLSLSNVTNVPLPGEISSLPTSAASLDLSTLHFCTKFLFVIWCRLALLFCMGIPLFPGYPITVCNRYISILYSSIIFSLFANIYNCKHLLFLLIVMMYLSPTLLHSSHRTTDTHIPIRYYSQCL